jgi:hypothetical protein
MVCHLQRITPHIHPKCLNQAHFLPQCAAAKDLTDTNDSAALPFTLKSVGRQNPRQSHCVWNLTSTALPSTNPLAGLCVLGESSLIDAQSTSYIQYDEEVAATAPEIEVCTPVSLSVMTHSTRLFQVRASSIGTTGRVLITPTIFLYNLFTTHNSQSRTETCKTGYATTHTHIHTHIHTHNLIIH